MIASLINQKKLSFLIDGAPMEEKTPNISVKSEERLIKTTYSFDGGLTLTNTFRYYPEYNACDWVNEWENKGSEPSGIISELLDADALLPFPPCKKKTTGRAYLHLPENVIKIYSPRGSDWSGDEFSCKVDELKGNNYTWWLRNVGDKKWYATVGGRSADSVSAPFFNVKHGAEDIGYIVAVGWTGQWNAQFERKEDGVRMWSKIEDTSFRILPGERFRTSSVTILAYEGSVEEGHNAFRKLIRDVYSPIKAPLDELPFCAGLWGGMSTAGCLDRIRKVEENRLPFNCYWMDAGWYGSGTAVSPDEYEGDWAGHTGNWEINKVRHPDGLMDVAKAIAKTDKRYLLWFEPERVRKGTPITSEHPEYIIFPDNESEQNALLNLGDERAWQYCFDTISEIIERLHVSIYRQDFNFRPLPYWRKNDTAERKGITEIKHIGGMYRLWDALRERFPGLLIDNCASGGRRIDIETLRRSIPLWRSDAQCPAEIDPTITQAHAISYGTWFPYTGTSVGRTLFDNYRFRSAFSPALTSNYTFSETNTFGDDPKAIEWIRERSEEYLRARPYLFKDVYPLTLASTAPDTWSAIQYHDTETDSGVVQVFRRESSPYSEAVFMLSGVSNEKEYVFEDADVKGETVTHKGLKTGGFTVNIDTRRTAKVFFYSVKK